MSMKEAHSFIMENSTLNRLEPKFCAATACPEQKIDDTVFQPSVGKRAKGYIYSAQKLDDEKVRLVAFDYDSMLPAGEVLLKRPDATQPNFMQSDAVRMYSYPGLAPERKTMKAPESVRIYNKAVDDKTSTPPDQIHEGAAVATFLKGFTPLYESLLAAAAKENPRAKLGIKTSFDHLAHISELSFPAAAALVPQAGHAGDAAEGKKAASETRRA